MRTGPRADGPRDFVPPIETHLLRSKHVAQTFKIQVMQPLQTYQEARMQRFPVVYATDGNFAFDVLKGISYSIQTCRRDARFILVGIGYPGESPATGSLLRIRDLTFPGYPKLSTEPPSIEGVPSSEPGTPDFEAAESFKQFLAEELVPLIDAKYPTARDDRTYFGHSAGGGFGLYTLFTRSEVFKNYLISSPGLIFNGTSSGGGHYEDYDFVLQRARAAIDSGRGFDGATLYLSVGSEEEFEPELVKWRMTSSFYRMAALLKSARPHGLNVITEVFAGETHLSVWPMAFTHGVQATFGSRMPLRGR